LKKNGIVEPEEKTAEEFDAQYRKLADILNKKAR
jgi:hypothetical protein